MELRSTSSVHQYKIGKYFLNVAGGNGGIAFHIKCSCGAQQPTDSTKRKNNQTVCGSSGVPTNQVDKKIALTPCGAGLFAYYGGLRSRITGDAVIFRQIYPKNREIKEQTLKS